MVTRSTFGFFAVAGSGGVRPQPMAAVSIASRIERSKRGVIGPREEEYWQAEAGSSARCRKENN